MSGGTLRPLSRLGLGTAQFGFAYGVTNARGQVPSDNARRILGLARDAGLSVIDTASTYGDAELLLGRLHDITRDFRIVSKSPFLGPERISREQADAVRTALAQSRQSLRRRRLDGFLVHHGSALLLPGGDRVIDGLREAKDRGEVERIGYSVYDPDELEAVLRVFVPDLVQLPLNILDQRFAARGLLARLKALHVEIHARSIFLQGGLLAAPEALPPALAHARPAFEAVHRFLAGHGLDPVAGCVGYALSLPEIDCLILGVTGEDELAAIIAAARALPGDLPDFVPLAVNDLDIISASRWRLPSSNPAL